MVDSTVAETFLRQREEFFDISTRWLASRMEYLRMVGEQPCDETQAQKRERIQADRTRRREDK